jgi:cephalosporin-C deacetylase
MPLTFDLPIEQLRTYEGKNPRPTDFDSFWDKSLAEMRSTDPNVELIAAEFQIPNVECFHLFFTGVGDVRVHAKLLRPANATSLHPAVLMFHGYTGDSGDWYDKLGFVSAGFTVAALDCRGQGGLSEDSGGVTGNTLHGHIIRGLDDALRVTLKRCSSDTSFLTQLNSPGSLWKCLM